jgi:hypothetical protein
MQEACQMRIQMQDVHYNHEPSLTVLIEQFSRAHNSLVFLSMRQLSQ